MREHAQNHGGFLRSIDIITAFVSLAVVTLSMTAAAQGIVSSPVYRQSRVISMLVQQDSLSLDGLLKDRRNIDTVVKFAGALTTAYINFEFIPVNEAGAFVAVFESLSDGVEIEKFEYRGTALAIVGTADSEEEYNVFLESLRDRGYFVSVTGSAYESTQDTTRFEIVCEATAVQTYLAF